MSPSPLKVFRIADVPVQSHTAKWLVEDLWGLEAVGIIGGAPKCCKSWFGLDLAVSVASGTPCLGCFQVQHKGPALVYLAEDAAPMVRQRVLGICKHRKIELNSLDLHLIDTPSLRLDLEADREKLNATIELLRPKLLILDPLVRLHRADENSSGEISAILGFIREIQRRFQTAVILVHHMSKKQRAQLGQALRGSGDLHAFGDCNAYLIRKQSGLFLSIEHRFAPSTDPISIALSSNGDGTNTHLEVSDQNEHVQRKSPLTERVRLLLSQTNLPMTRLALRNKLKVNNQSLGDALSDLEQKGLAFRDRSGWRAKRNPSKAADSQTPIQTELF